MKNNKKTDLSTVKKVVHYLRPHMLWVILSLLFAVVGVAVTLYIPILIGDAIDLIPDIGNVDFQNVTSILLSIGICIAIGAIVQWLMNVCNNKITYEVVESIRNEAFEKIQKLPISYLDSHRR